ncbi:MAG: sugar phosphate isomerase/epimerase family protein [Zavarzinella sp.]
MIRIDRRQLLSQGAAFAAALVAGSRVIGAETAKKYDISLAQWSLHRMLQQKKLAAIDFPKYTKETFDIHAVEYVNQFYMDKKKDDNFVKDLLKRTTDLGVKNLLIMCDREGALGDADEKKRTTAVENHYRWVEWAKMLGCHSIRVNASSSGTYEEQMARAADGLRKLTEFAAKMEINVIVENHGGLSSNGTWLAGTIKKVDHPRCGTLPDFGNFNLGGGKQYDRYKGVEELMPFAKGVSAKSHDFDEKGNEKATDFRKMMKIVAAAGYTGFIGIEYEGGRLSENDGIIATKKLLETVFAEMKNA